VPVEKYVVGRAASATDGSVASMIGELAQSMRVGTLKLAALLWRWALKRWS
jgi:hypothetical protein